MKECRICQVPIGDRGRTARFCDGCIERNRRESNRRWAAKHRRKPTRRFCCDCGQVTKGNASLVLCDGCREVRKNRVRKQLAEAMKGPR